MIVTDTTVARLYLAKLRRRLAKDASSGVHLAGRRAAQDSADRGLGVRRAGRQEDQPRCRRCWRSAAAWSGTSRASPRPATSAASRYVQIPTTLLAQVDSSVGGKTGVNHSGGKNLIGAFHQPLAVITDTDTLATLPDRELRAGLAEVIKYGCVWDPLLFDWLDTNIDEAARARRRCAHLRHRRSCEIKATVVAQDEREQSLRAILNFGHTFGHAIEAATAYETYLHGEAVGLGHADRRGSVAPLGADRRRHQAIACATPVRERACPSRRRRSAPRGPRSSCKWTRKCSQARCAWCCSKGWARGHRDSRSTPRARSMPP